MVGRAVMSCCFVGDVSNLYYLAVSPSRWRKAANVLLLGDGWPGDGCKEG